MSITHKIKKEIRVILSAFILLGTVSVGLLFFTFYQATGIHIITSKIYEHPLQVSNAALNLKSEILKIHKDVHVITMDITPQERDVLIQHIDQHEKHIVQYATIIKERILGEEGAQQQQEMQKLLDEWQETRYKIIFLIKNGQRIEAVNMAETKESAYISKLEISISGIYEYAQGQARGFMAQSNAFYKDFKLTEFLIIAILTFIFIFVAYFSIHKVSKYIIRSQHLTGVLAVIQSVNQLIVREKDINILLQECCNILASKHIFEGAWIVLIDEEQRVEYIAGSNAKRDLLLLKEKIQSGWTPTCIEKTIQTHTTCSFTEKSDENCSKCPLFNLYGGNGTFNVALKDGDTIIGYLTLSVNEKQIKYDDEVLLLEEVAKDISYALKHIKTEKNIEELKELYSNTVNSVENLIFVKDTDFTYIACNKAFEKFIGKSTDEIIGKSDYDIVDKEMADLFRKNDIRMLSDKMTRSNFEWVTYPDGQKIYLLTVKSPLFDSKGNIIGLVGNSVDITKEKVIEDSLKATQIRYEETEKIGHVGSWEYILDTQEFWGSTEAKRIYGFKEDSDAFSIERVESCIPERECVHQALIDLLEKGTEYNLEFKIHPFDKTPAKIISSIAEVEYDQNNRPLKVKGFIQDITDRKRAEKLLHESEKQFKQLMKESPSVIEIYDLEGTQIEVNHAYEVLWGFPASLTLNKFNLFKSEEVKNRGLLEYIKRAYAGESVVVPIYEFDSRGSTEAGGPGRIRKLNTRLYPLKDSAGNIKNIVITHEDVTEKEDSILALKQKKAELETIIKESPNPIVLHTDDGKIIMLNQAWIDATGYSIQETPTVFEFIDKIYEDPAMKSRVKEHVQSLYSITAKVDDGEFTFINKNRNILTWQFSSAPLGMIDGKHTVISSATDITELKRKDEMMLAQSRHAAMGEMISMIAHQWRQPISVVSMIANNMLLDLSLEEFKLEDGKKYAEEIIDQTKHLSKTIDDFRNFFKPDKEISKVKLSDVLDETFSIVKDSLKNNNIDYKIVNDSGSEIDAYPRELMQVFVNIITNAKDAMVSNNIKDALLKITLYEDTEYVYTEICDNGGGIDEEVLPKIFEPYFTTKDEKTGTGLGLYMSKSIIEDHLHGSIEAKNVDKGVCFTVKLLKKALAI
ncbi:PAS domain S-box protein [bacterium]|nr:PAS domain S-box protein [bacterium]MBU1883140.1 PAS domain S-box protein [bacterium]